MTDVSEPRVPTSKERNVLDSLSADYTKLRLALLELVRLKDLKTDAEAINTSGDWGAVRQQRAMLAEHDAKRGEAWDAARRALSGDSSAPETAISTERATFIELLNLAEHFLAERQPELDQNALRKRIADALTQAPADETKASPFGKGDTVSILGNGEYKIAEILTRYKLIREDDGSDVWADEQFVRSAVKTSVPREWVIACGNSWYGPDGKFVKDEWEARGFPSCHEAQEHAKGMRCPWSVHERTQFRVNGPANATISNKRNDNDES